jgi:hypothetical protein
MQRGPVLINIANQRSNYPKQRKRPVRIFFGLLELGGYYSGLCHGLRECGIPCSHLALNRTRIDRYLSEVKQPLPFSLLYKILKIIESTKRNRLLNAVLRRIALPSAKLVTLIWAVFRHDVFVFGFAESFFGLRELPILRMLSKQIVFVFHGSDSRPAYINGKYTQDCDEKNLADVAKLTRRQRQLVEQVEKLSDICINNPPGAHFHKNPFINHSFLGHPTYFKVPSGRDSVLPADRPNVFKILHAPSDPIGKGTNEIRMAIVSLRLKGYQIELKEVQGRPNHEVLEALVWCDLVVDQMYSDIPFACFASEAALAGKAALVGSYAQSVFKEFAGKIGMPTDLFVRPEELENTIEKLINNNDFLKHCAQSAQHFITTFWSPVSIAERFLKILDGSAPPEWWFDSNTVDYLHGYGSPEPKLQIFLKKYIDFNGESALQLNNKPELKKKFVSFANQIT